MNHNHFSCSPDHKETIASAKQAGFRSYLLGAVAAFISCLCCSLPLIPLILGLSGATSLREQLGNYHWLFEIVSIMILIAACLFMWKRNRKHNKPLKSLLLQIAFTLTMYFSMTVIMQKLIVPAFFGDLENSVHAHQ
jgi:chromate transport protein ChrA